MNYNDLNISDKANIYHRNTEMYYTGVVVKKSKTTITVKVSIRGEEKNIIFNLSSGSERGCSDSYGYWGSTYLTDTPVERCNQHNREIMLRNKRDNLAFMTRELSWSKVSEEDLETIYKIVKPYYLEQKNAK